MQSKQPYIFISYAHKDTALVMPIIEQMQKWNFCVWYDTGIEAGTEWPEYIATKLLASHCVIAFISKNAMNSHNCRREINFAIAKNKDLLVIYLEELELSPGMQMQLDVLQAMFYYRCPSLDIFVKELCKARLLQSCRSEAVPPQPEPSPKLPDPPISGALNSFVKNQPVSQILCEPEVPAEPVPEPIPVVDEPESPPDPEHLYQLGIACAIGDGVEQNHKTAVDWFRKAALLDYPPAQNAMGECCETGFGIACDCAAAVEWYRKAAGQNYAPALANLGKCCQNGTSMPKNISEAMRLYHLAAEQGNAKAQYCIGHCHETGVGAAMSIVEAVKWYRLSAEQGYAPAQCSLALCYEKGAGVPKSTVQAAKYFLLAAQQEYRLAQYHLSLCYEKGLGVPKNANEARKWRALSQM